MKWIYKILNRNKVALILVVSGMAASHAGAQITNPFSNSYFRNQYLSNPAMAGKSLHDLDFNIGYRNEGASIPDAPRNQYLTGTYGISDKVGLGIKIYNDKAGLINTTRAMATYAYHVALDENDSKLFLGISAGIWRSRIDNAAINGNPDDPGIGKFNNRGALFDIDFGAAYTNHAWTIQGAFPGMVTYFKEDQDDDVIGRTVFFTAVSYRFLFNKDESPIEIEPKVSYRNMKGFDDVLDAGANVAFMNDLLNVFGVYHSTKSISFGAGVNVKGMVHIDAAYNTGAATLKNYTKGTFEIGIGLTLKDAK